MHPILFKLGPITIYSYGLMIALGIMVGLFLARRQAKREGIDPDKILDITLYVLLAALIGARLLFVFMNFAEYVDEPLRILKIWEGGLVFYGGLLPAVAIGIWYIKRLGLPLWQIADILAPSLAIGHAMGRIGCFFAGCCYGGACDLPWAVTFTNPQSLATPRGSLTPHATLQLPQPFCALRFSHLVTEEKDLPWRAVLDVYSLLRHRPLLAGVPAGGSPRRLSRRGALPGPGHRHPVGWNFRGDALIFKKKRRKEGWPSLKYASIRIRSCRSRPLHIENIDERIARLAGEMAETMYAAPGVGLAAPQVGVSERLIVVDVRNSKGEKDLITLVNPQIMELGERIVEEEGCLSVPGIREQVARARRVLVRGYDLNERERQIEAEGLLAVAFQHEIDHLDGILFIDRISRLKRGIIQRKMRKLMREGQPSEKNGSRLF